MSEETFVLVPNGESIYAVPTDICIKYELEGEKLDGAKAVLAESESDVEGQGYRRNSRGEVYTSRNGVWSRAPHYD